MGFSVSASAAIIFISFLVAAGTLYSAWDSSYSNVQAAREDWYSLRISQMYFNVNVVSLSRGDYDNDGSADDLEVVLGNNGTTVRALFDVIDDGIYIGNLDRGYLLPGGNLSYVVVNALVDTTNVHNETVSFPNGCIVWFAYQYSSTAPGVTLVSSATYCPTEVS
ncbi:hypothetical protein A3L09_04465 [Thermococcus profundus]|uniref:Uncharacterized protein n=1 Tax=Thermococcus profundus TaxID=49899 RepID=A0A2Z2MCX7_THEPR|nr:flagellar protein [Thermococcus profundus]ASJ02562.1 hypothetical protein A3L09_04465 [Thermococcus profundus]